jgi:hypothetical protein
MFNPSLLAYATFALSGIGQAYYGIKIGLMWQQIVAKPAIYENVKVVRFFFQNSPHGLIELYKRSALGLWPKSPGSSLFPNAVVEKEFIAAVLAVRWYRTILVLSFLLLIILDIAFD